jgi:transposase-like protein
MTVMSENRTSKGQVEDFRRKPRWSANKKTDVVLRLLRGEPLDELSRELGVEAHRLAAWRDDFLEHGRQGLKANPSVRGDATERRLRHAERKVGELTMENEILRAAAEKRGLKIPPKKRPR